MSARLIRDLDRPFKLGRLSLLSADAVLLLGETVTLLAGLEFVVGVEPKKEVRRDVGVDIVVVVVVVVIGP
jgi:hypothetical protein